ncbi:MAG: SDR family oxidoreductase [Phycisphaerales bacterium]|nr:SDR family oxidoreductase [Phycisphaerales bacterium]
MSRLSEQTFFVTGACGGIGGALVRKLAAAGAKLVVSDIDATKLEALAKELGPNAFPITADTTDENAVTAAMASAVQRLGYIDVLINVPGMSVPAKIWEMNLADYQRIFDVNVKGMFLCSKHFMKQTNPERGGLIISMSSIAGKTPNPNAPVYCAAKAAINMISGGLAMQTKQANVKVSIISPGSTSTKGFWGDRQVPHEKFLKPEDVADMICFVAGLPSTWCFTMWYSSLGNFLRPT